MKLSHTLKTMVSAVILSGFMPGFAHADVAVVVHPSNTVEMDARQLKRIFMGKAKKFPGGGQAIPINQEEGSNLSEEFNAKVLKRSASQLKSYWSKLVFTGKGTPPKEVPDSAEMMKLISTNPNLIGYVDASEVNESVRVITTL